VEALEKCVAVLEGGHGALACSSGMAAIHTTLVSLLKTGDHIILSDVVYGPTCTLVETVLARGGIEASIVATSDLDAVQQALRPNTKVVFIETPGNPTLVITDLEAICRLAHERGALVVVDNTFMSPILQQPIRWGADIVVHSLTKFLNGHADVVGGIIVVNDAGRHKAIRQMLNQLGGVLSPLEAFLVHRGIKTLALRMHRHCKNAQQVAAFLAEHPAVEWVRYPGLSDHPQYEIARKQMSGSGGMISFGLKGGVEAGRKLMNAVELCTLAVSLGGVETLIQHPASMTHASIGSEARRRGHITDGLVRLSVGIENVDDIITDLEQALSLTTQKATAAVERVDQSSADQGERDATNGKAVVELNDHNFKVQTLEGVTLVDFWAPWCNPCVAQAPILERVAEHVGDKARIAKLNVIESPATPAGLGILAIPTLLLLKDGEVVERFVGVCSEDVLVAALQAILDNGRP